MFWRKKSPEEKAKEKKREKEVKKIEGALWGYMVSRGVTVDVLQNLRRVERNGEVEDKSATMIRIFDPAAADKKGIAIDDYQSLDNHPELILYEGYYREVSGHATDIRIEKK